MVNSDTTLGYLPNKHIKKFHQIRKNVFCEFSDSMKKPKIRVKIYDFVHARVRTINANYLLRRKFRIFRYENYKHFIDNISYGHLFMSRPNADWSDPFEKLFYNDQNLRSLSIDALCLCFKYDWIMGEEAAWKSYGKTDENDAGTIRVAYDFEKLMNILNLTAEKLGIVFYLSVVDYSRSKKRISFIENKSAKVKSIEEFISLMSMKRRAFANENELRLFAIKKDGHFDKKTIPCKKLDSVIPYITLNKDFQSQTKEYRTIQEAIIRSKIRIVEQHEF